MYYKCILIFGFLGLITFFAVAQPADRLETQRRLQEGIMAPDIILNQPSIKNLGSISAEKTLVVFWSSLCSHCNQSMPRLKEFYDATNHKDLEIVAVSLDTSLKAWNASIKKHGYTWVNHCDIKSWYGLPAMNYGIYRLPAMILLDKNKRIEGRPENLEELQNMLDQKIIINPEVADATNN
jgi:thiol-disulfide isomerase/thioredoxin